MANMTDEQARFVGQIADYVSQYAPLYDIEVYSPIIAQAILESAWGTSDLAKHHNYFGLKPRSKWCGAVYNKDTREETPSGEPYWIYSAFRAYPNMADGVLGYFVFLFEPEAYGRYDNLKYITDPIEYLETIKSDGYATDTKYVQKLTDVINQYDLTRYDNQTSNGGNSKVEIIKRIVAPGHGNFTPPNPIYFAVHSTANPGATAANHVTYWTHTPDYAVHFVSDWDTAYQCVELDRKCWQVGNGNYTCIGLEICEPKGYDYDKFMRGLEIARSVILQTLERYGWTVDGAVRSHKWFTENYGGSDHTDPIPYFKRYGWTWEKFIDYLKEEEMPTANEIAKAVNDYKWGDKAIGQMIRETYDEAVKENDPTGRGNTMRDHEHIKWIAKVQSDTYELMKENNELLKQLIAKL